MKTTGSKKGGSKKLSPKKRVVKTTRKLNKHNSIDLRVKALEVMVSAIDNAVNESVNRLKADIAERRRITDMKIENLDDRIKEALRGFDLPELSQGLVNHRTEIDEIKETEEKQNLEIGTLTIKHDLLESKSKISTDLFKQIKTICWVIWLTICTLTGFVAALYFDKFQSMDNVSAITRELVALDPTLILHDESEWSGIESGKWSSFNSGGVECEVGEYLYSLVRLLKPSNVLETGTHLGVGASYIGTGLANNGFGHLDTVEFQNPNYMAACERLQTLKLNNYVRVHLMDVANFPVVENKYDLIFLDTEPQTRFDELVRFFQA